MMVNPLSRLKEDVLPGQWPVGGNFSAGWLSPSNIALVKYWGKKAGQLPTTPSLSMTLARAVTQTRLGVLFDEPAKGLVSVNGDPFHPFLPKMQQLLRWMADEIPVLQRLSLVATTENSFPHSTGIASSASGISAFTLCLLDIARKLLKAEISHDELMHQASFASRMGSGSACRSVYGGYAEWGEAADVTGSSDAFAIPWSGKVHPEMLSLHDAILVISANPKSLPSTQGHKGMNGHPFYNGRLGQAGENLREALLALSANDFEKLGAVAELEALTLHALIMSANPGTLLMKPTTVEVIHRIREARKGGLPLFFTLDAGANVHVLYPGASARMVEDYITDALQPLCEGGQVIFDGCGKGPIPLGA
jgi:diphosphomevalonate decarboxylase